MAKFVSKDGKEIYEHSRKKRITVDGVEYTRVKAPEYKSRARRCSDVVSSLETIVSDLESLKDELGEMQLDDQTDETEPKLSEEQKARIKEIGEEAEAKVSEASGLSDIDGLVDEIQNWKSGLEGTNLENSDKYNTLSETLDALETAQSTLEGLSLDTSEDPDELTQSIESVIGDIQEATSNLENAEFPGMYG